MTSWILSGISAHLSRICAACAARYQLRARIGINGVARKQRRRRAST